MQKIYWNSYLGGNYFIAFHHAGRLFQHICAERCKCSCHHDFDRRVEARLCYRGREAFPAGLKLGYQTGGSMTGNVVRAGNPGGTHGYLPGYKDMEASFFIAGSTFPSGRNLGTIDMRDIARQLQ